MDRYTGLLRPPHLHSPLAAAVAVVESHQTWECHLVEEEVVGSDYQQLKHPDTEFESEIRLDRNS